MYKRILLATDGSKLSDKAVQTAMELTQIFSADLVVVKVVPHYIQTLFRRLVCHQRCGCEKHRITVGNICPENLG